MTRAQRRSKSQHHNRMKRLGYKWFRRAWWESWRFSPLLVARGNVVPVWHSDHEEAR